MDILFMNPNALIFRAMLVSVTAVCLGANLLLWWVKSVQKRPLLASVSSHK